MCNIGKWFGPSKAEKQAQAEALLAQQKAAELAKAAMVPVQDSDPARASGDARMRRVLSMRGVASAMAGGSTPAARFGGKVLLGA